MVEYFLGDALGSVHQMTDPTGEVTFTQSYDPGVYPELVVEPVETLSKGDSHHYSTGTSQTAYGFTGEQYSAETQMVYLRAR